MNDIIKKLFDKAFGGRLTVLLGVVWAVVSAFPELLVQVFDLFGAVATPELSARVVAISLIVARFRDKWQPWVTMLLGGEKKPPSA